MISQSEKPFQQQSGGMNNHYKQFFLHYPDAVYCLDSNGTFLDMNPAGVKLTGYSVEELRKMTFLPFIPEEDRERTLQHFARALAGEQRIYDMKMVDKFGCEIDINVTNIPVKETGEITGVCGFAKNISEQKRIEERIERLTFYDGVSGLPNEALLRNLLQHEIDHKRPGLLMCLRLENVQTVNETLGFQSGNQLIKEVIERIKETIQSCLIAKMSGNEFAFLFTDKTEADEAARLARQILCLLEEPFIISGLEFCVTGNIGVAMYPLDGEDVEEVLKNGHQAMKQAGRQRKNNYAFFTAEMNAKVVRRLMIENGLRKAIHQNSLAVYYQPRINTFTDQVVGMEALLRWEHPELGKISPVEFIPIAEETGLIIPIGEWVLKAACTETKKWQDAVFPNLRVSVNLSVLQIQQENLVEIVAFILQETGLDGKWLELEITEQMLMGIEQNTIETLLRLQTMGIQISLDDFGTGYCSLRYLKDLPINQLKIDQSFIQKINEQKDIQAIVDTIISVAKTLALKVTAEGVEQVEQFHLLKEKQCDEVQGFLFSQPLSKDDFEIFLAKQATGTVSEDRHLCLTENLSSCK